MKSKKHVIKTIYLDVLFISIFITALSAATAFPGQDNESQFHKMGARFAEFVNIEKIETESLILTFIQDRDDFFWIGANNGLYKYDGYTFKQYITGPDGLAGSTVNALYEDSHGLIWIGTMGGVTVYDKATDRFTSFFHDPNNPGSISNSTIGDTKQQSIVEDVENNIWIGTANGLNKFDRVSQTFIRYKDIFSDNDIWSLCRGSDHHLWIGTATGLHKFNPQKGTVVERYHAVKHESHKGQLEGGQGEIQDHSSDIGQEVKAIQGEKICALFTDREGWLWVGTMTGGLYRTNAGEKGFTRYLYNVGKGRPTHGGILSITQDDSGMIWIGTTGGGLNMFDKSSQTFTEHRFNPEDKKSVAGNYISNVYQDALGALWFSSYGGVLHRTDFVPKKFLNLVHDPQNDNSLSRASYIAHGIEDREGRIWIAVGGDGINRYDRRRGELSRFRHDPDDPHSVPESYGQSLIEDVEGKLWFSTQNWIIQVDKETGKVIEKHFIGDWPSSPVLDRADDNIIWYGTWGAGLLKFNRVTGETTSFKAGGSKLDEQLSDNTIPFLTQDDDGMIWLCYRGAGIDLFDPRTEKVIAKYKHSAMDLNSLSSNTVYQLFRDLENRYWVTTDKGLDLFDVKAGKFKRFNRYSGSFPLNTACQILEDSEGFLWISGYYQGALVKFDPDSYQYRLYNADDGLLMGLGSGFPALKTRDELLWFFGREGVNYFDPKSITDSTFQPNVFITALRQGGEHIQTGKALEKSSSIQLDWRHNYFEFDMAALNYLHSDHNRYRYRLEGMDHEWFDSGKIRQGRYTGISPGEYTLKIQGSNNDGIWSDHIATLKIIVPAPWWETTMVKVFSVLVTILLLLIGYHIRMRSIKEQKRQLEVKVEERTQELQESVEQIKVLSGMLPICSSCKMVRDDKGYWSQIESYIARHSEAEFSHGICPECAEKYYPGMGLYDE